MRGVKVLVLFICICCFIPQPAASSAQFSGVVVDAGGQPVSKAVVRLQGASFSTLTDEGGRFSISAEGAVSSKYITAWKHGFYNGGKRISAKNRNYIIKLAPVPQGDNQDYKWMQPLRSKEPKLSKGKVKEKTCQDCHTKDFMGQWENSAHARAAINPFFLSFFNGTDISGKNTVGPGYKLDFKNSNGNCAACHVPAMALNNPFNSDPNKAQGVEKQGVFCDFCHKITEVNIDKTGGYPGVLSIKFQRPPEGEKIFFGPYDDVFPGPDSYNPLYKNSKYCASCHNGSFWNVLVYPEFQEWSESSYARKDIHCQDCHMKPDGKMSRFVQARKGGLLRDPKTVYSHGFSGIGDRAFMREALELKTHAVIAGDLLEVTVTLRNTKAGHHYPTGNPMRNMILLVQVSDEKGMPLEMARGEKVPLWGGVGEPGEGNYSGLPGKGYAKILRDLLPYPGNGRAVRHFKQEYPAPPWRPTVIESDNRIPANGADISIYQFQLADGLSGPFNVTSKLIFRRAYKSWADAKGLKSDDLEVAADSVIIYKGR